MKRGRICPTDYIADMKQTRLVFYVFFMSIGLKIAFNFCEQFIRLAKS